jgi:hypothetical protein
VSEPSHWAWMQQGPVSYRHTEGRMDGTKHLRSESDSDQARGCAAFAVQSSSLYEFFI